MSWWRKKQGFTLVELLVVTGLIASLLSLLVVVGRPSEQSGIRRAAQDLAGALLAAQTRALGKVEGAGVLIPASGTNSRIATLAYEATPQPVRVVSISGTSGSWPPADLGTLPRKHSTLVRLNPADAIAEANTFKLRFQSPSGDILTPWFLFASGTALGEGLVRFRSSTGQTSENTTWPKGNGLMAAMVQYPTQSVSTLAAPKRVAIDLRHSGVGENPNAAHGYGRLDLLGTIGVMYDEVGRLSEVMCKVMEPRSVTDPAPAVAGETVYFLFAAQSDIEQNQSLSSQNSVWVAINPVSGRATVADNVPQAGDSAAALAAARVKAREGSSLR